MVHSTLSAPPFYFKYLISNIFYSSKQTYNTSEYITSIHSFLICIFLAFLYYYNYNVIMKSLVVDKKYDGKKLNTFLYANFNGLKSSTFFSALENKDIKINGNRIKENITVHFLDKIDVYIKDELLESNFDIQKVYEDDNILIINKPSNIEVLGDNSLTSILEKNYLFIKPCHRLDRNTTGLILFAKNEISEKILLEKFKNKEIQKHYIAEVYGIPKVKEKRLEAYLFKDSKHSIVYISDEFKKGYQKIITSYKVISSNIENNTSVLDINLETGRTHQIRAHLAHIGLPIIGDR